MNITHSRQAAHERLLSTAEAASRLGTSVSTLHRRVRDGQLSPVVRGAGLRGAMFFDAEEIEALAGEAK